MAKHVLALGALTAAAAREDDKAGAIAEATGLSETTVRRRLEDAHGKTFVRNVFEREWPTEDGDDVESLGDTTTAAAREDNKARAIAEATGLSEAGVRRRLEAAHGKTLVRNVFEHEWPGDCGDDDAVVTPRGGGDVEKAGPRITAPTTAKKLSGDEVRRRARELLAESPGGIRFSRLVSLIERESPETPHGTVTGNIWDLHVRFPDEVTKPDRGLFKSIKQPAIRGEALATAAPIRRLESDFYEPFAEFLKNELDEATDAVALGGNAMKDKWGTPDVVGVYRPRASDRIKFNHEIIAVEIKTDPGQTVTAFGQAVAYRLFATKTYIGMPESLDDEGRLEALCMLFGVGLVLFSDNPRSPNFSIRVRAQRLTPDMFYVNQFADRLHQHDRDIFEKLFR
jgi:hypothetical protein